MGWRFRRSVKIAPGVRLNVGKRGSSVSVGVPGTGASYVTPLTSQANAAIPRKGRLGRLFLYAVLGFIGLMLIGVFAPRPAAPPPLSSEQVEAIRTNPSALIELAGPPDSDEATDRDKPRPPMITRILKYAGRDVSAIYASGGGFGKPHNGKWVLARFQSVRSGAALSEDTALARLRR
jgi:hypothetical protein